MSQPILSIIIVNYNVKDFLNQALDSIRKAAAGLAVEVIVVDNASRDGSVRMIEENYPEVILIRNEQNAGFARANNDAISRAAGEYLLFLNPDTLVQEDTFTAMIQFFREHPDAGMAGCKILNPDGSLQLACRRSIPTPWVAFTKLIGLAAFLPKSRLFGKYNLSYLDPDQTAEVDAVSGSFMMVRQQALRQVGNFDDQFFMYGEDLDLCYRFNQAGWKIYYVPATKIVHYKGASTEKARIDMILIFYRAMLLFARKHFRGKYLFFPQWFLIFGIAVRAALSFVINAFDRLKWVLIDSLILNISLGFALFIRFGSLIHWKSYLLVTAIYTPVWLFSFYLFDLYENRKFSPFRAIYSVLLGLSINSTITYFAKNFAFSRMVVLLAGGFNLILIPGWRYSLKKIAQILDWSFLDRLRKTYFRKEAILVGDSDSVSHLMRKFSNQFEKNTEVVAAVLTDSLESSKNGFANLPVLNDIDNLPWYIEDYKANEVIFSSDAVPYERILALISESKQSGIEFKIASKKMEVIIGSTSVDYLGDISLVDIDYRLAHGPYRSFKRFMDLLAAVMLMIPSILVWPVLFARGFRIRRVPIWNEWANYVKKRSSGNPVTVFLFSKGARPAFSRFEKLPLLINLFRGDITLVGAELQFEPVKDARQSSHLQLQPGLISLLGSHGWENRTEPEKRQYLIYYLKNYSPLLDLEILLKALGKR